MTSALCANMGSSIELAERVLAHSPAVAQRRYPLNTLDSNDPASVPVLWDSRLPDRFWERVSATDTCWNWVGARFKEGYGQYRHNLAHRTSYSALVGPIPKGLTIDHLCRNKACVNPAHLEAVTQLENNRRHLRGTTPKSHCKNGHPFTAENTYARPGGKARGCRTCTREAKVRYEARKQAELDAYLEGCESAPGQQKESA